MTKKDVHILLDLDLFRRVRVKCAQEGIRFQELVRQLLA